MGLVCQPRTMSCWTTVFCLSLLYLLAGGGAQPSPPSVYDALKQYNFPSGILPQGVTGYDLDPTTGQFTAHLNGKCGYKLGGYKLRYEPTITGFISQGKLEELHGVAVKVLFFWVNVEKVQRNGDDLEFTTRIKSATFPVSGFGASPQCGCGFQCGNAADNIGIIGKGMRVKLKSNAS
ncbi:hypothetical protein RJ640_019935 [Escallonia rubra]|uniref:Uncharacterized protein n=1 Tax=Escallonia rubra TaxID=112253 RepID=A0AA88QLT8_9ASTE|nr:hypothetical protein RJ640_019935 [Escallonia rubra]